jgi:protein-disulfide isomerase
MGMDERATTYDRRAVLRRVAAGTVGVTGLAGCLGADSSGETTEENPFASGDDGGTTATQGGATSETNDATTAGGETTAGDDGLDVEVGIAEGGDFGGHSATQGLTGQPYFGPAPGSAKGTIVAFEDPSCPRCRSFETGAADKIRRNLAADGEATFVFRGYPVVYPWGEPASKVLEATLARSARAHFAMAREYFVRQSGFSTDNVWSASERTLRRVTDLDAETVVAEAREGEFDDAVQVDLDAGEAVGASATPSVYLFRDGEYRTTFTGSVSYDAITTALGL